MNEIEKEALETMQHWIAYEKENKHKINKADDLILMQETILNLVYKQDKKSSEILTKIRLKIKELEKEKKQELIGTKGQDRYYIKQKYNNKIEILKEILESDK